MRAPEPDADVLLFFEGRAKARETYGALERFLYGAFPDVRRRVQKTQITFSSRHVFACASFARVKRKAELPGAYMVVTLGLPAPLESPRVAVSAQPRPGRWTHHIVVGGPETLDDELRAWIGQAYAFAAAGQGRGGARPGPR